MNRISIIPSSLLVEKKVMRVPGGYMNRWLIRAEVVVPSKRMIHDLINNRIYMHPEMIKALHRVLPSGRAA